MITSPANLSLLQGRQTFLRLLDTSIKRISPQDAGKSRQREEEMHAQASFAEPTAVENEEMPAQRIGIVFNFNHKAYPGFVFDAVTGESNEEVTVLVGK